MANMVITNEMYEMVQKMANKYAYGQVNSIRFEQFVSVGIEGLANAIKEFKEGTRGFEGKEKAFSSFAYMCVNNLMKNEKERQARHFMELQDGYDMATWNGKCKQSDHDWQDIITEFIEREMKKNERNIAIVKSYFGIGCDPMGLKDIAEMFKLSHESVRLLCNKVVKAIKVDSRAEKYIFSCFGD